MNKCIFQFLFSLCCVLSLIEAQSLEDRIEGECSEFPFDTFAGQGREAKRTRVLTTIGCIVCRVCHSNNLARLLGRCYRGLGLTCPRWPSALALLMKSSETLYTGEINFRNNNYFVTITSHNENGNFYSD